MADRIRRIALAAIALPLLFLAMPGMARASTITVTSLSDTGATGICILRDAITAANSKTATNGCAAGSGTDTIVFKPGLTGTIALGSTLPTITDSNLTITGPTAAPGIAISGGGAVQVMEVGGSATLLQNLTFFNGSTGVNGGGISNGGTLTVTNCTFSDNRAVNSGVGGGIYNVGTLTVTNSTFSGNSSGQGGGIYSNNTLTVTNSTFSGNSTDEGGGIDNDGTLTVTNSTFSANRAILGGGIDNFGTMTVTNSTFSGNGAAAGGINNSGSATLKGTILAAEPLGGNCTGGVTDANYNISDDASCDFTEAPSGKSINNSTTLNLDPAGLQNNGGPTQTIAIEPNSQALDFIPVADCTDQSETPQPLRQDQRGFPRPDSGNLNACDAGAFELQTGRISVAPMGERVQIVRSTTSADADQINMAFSFTDNGSPSPVASIMPMDPVVTMAPALVSSLNCDDGTDALNGVSVDLLAGTCDGLATATGGLLIDLTPWVVHTVGGVSYGTIFQSFTPSPETVSARIVQLAKPPTACGEWSLNIEVAGLDTAALNLGGGNPFALVVQDGDKNAGCFDVTNAIVGNPVTPPGRTVRRGVRR